MISTEIINGVIKLSRDFDGNFKSGRFIDAEANVEKMKQLIKTSSNMSDPDIVAMKELIYVSTVLLLKANEKPKLNKSYPILLNIYYGNSEESQNFLPVWKSLKSSLIMAHLKFNTFSVDASNEKYYDIVKKYNVSKFPSLVIIKPNGINVHYNGEINLSKILDFLTKI
jgi:hypothetical protein